MRREGPAGNTPARNDDAFVEPAGGSRRLVEARCGFAEKARAEATAAVARLAEAKHTYEARAAAATSDQIAIDAAATQASKDAAHRTFRAAVAGARARSQVEAAAVAWLGAINEINGESRAARSRIERELEAVEALLAEVARLADIAEASATMAAEATRACDAARAALAAEEADAAGAGTLSGPKKRTGTKAAGKGLDAAAAVPPAPSLPGATVPGEATWNGSPSGPPVEAPPDANRSPTDWLVIDIRSPEPQVIIRLMRRDGRIMAALVDRVAGADPTARRCWQLLLSTFVDSVAAAAIDDGDLVFPADNPFWSQFSADESRETARGLAALGFRFDGFSAFVDGRVPTHRDLSLAVGSTGLLPARVHYWPRPHEAADLFKGVRPSTDTFIASRAPALTLGELVRILGHRAELLADLWNEWPTVRPLLLSTGL